MLQPNFLLSLLFISSPLYYCKNFSSSLKSSDCNLESITSLLTSLLFPPLDASYGTLRFSELICEISISNLLWMTTASPWVMFLCVLNVQRKSLLQVWRISLLALLLYLKPMVWSLVLHPNGPRIRHIKHGNTSSPDSLSLYSIKNHWLFVWSNTPLCKGCVPTSSCLTNRSF